MKNLKKLCEEKRTLIDKLIESYSEYRDCYKDDFEMQLCIEEDLSCNEIYDEVEQESLARYIVSEIIEKKSDTKRLDTLIEGATARSGQPKDQSQYLQPYKPIPERE